MLIGIPYHKNKRYCLDHLFDWLEQADIPGEVVLREHRGTFAEQDAVKTQREFFRQLALTKHCSHLMYVGADTIPPLDAVPRLLSHQLDVVGGVYFNRMDPDRAIAWRNGQPEWNRKGNLPTDGVHEVDGMGMDFVLFSRNAFEKVSFFDWAVKDDDFPYYDRLKAKGFKIYLDTSLIARHYQDGTHFI